MLRLYCVYWTVWDRYLQVLYLGRAPRTKETLPDFLKWRRVTRPPLVFRGLTGSQRTPGFWGVTIWAQVVVDIHINVILDCLGQVFLQVLYLGRAPRTKETLPDFREKCRVTRHSRVFRGLTGSQRTPGFGVSHI